MENDKKPMPHGSTSAPDPILPFGKYKGKRCSQIEDVKYLDWLIGADWLGQPLKGNIHAHLRTRADWKAL